MKLCLGLSKVHSKSQVKGWPDATLSRNPTLNERNTISDVINATGRALDGHSYEIIVVDKSSDETRTLATRAGARVIHQSYRGGVGTAFREEFSHARGQVVVKLAA